MAETSVLIYTSDIDSGWNNPSVKIITIHSSGLNPWTCTCMVLLYTIRSTSHWLDDGAYCILYTGLFSPHVIFALLYTCKQFFPVFSSPRHILFKER